MLDLSLGNDIYKSNIWDAARQELDLIFYTTNTELIGYPEFGSNFDDFLWTITPTSTALTEYIEDLLSNTIFVSKLKHHIDIKHQLDESNYENVYIVSITLYDDFNSTEKIYRLNEKL